MKQNSSMAEDYDILPTRLSCILYTLKGKTVDENKYINIFLIWLSYVCKFAELKPFDCVQIIIDEYTYEQLMKYNHAFKIILQKFECEIQFIQQPQPATLSEGMMMRYTYVPYPQEVFMYCDIDVLITQPLHKLYKSLKPNTIVLHHEGSITDKNYGEAFSKEYLECNQNIQKGYSSGKFLVYGADLVKALFDSVQNLSQRCPIQNYYCLDQPVFNTVVYQLHEQKQCSIDDTRLSYPVISTNDYIVNSEQTVLMDYMGQPGDDSLHFTKVFTILLHDFVNKKIT